MHSILFVATMDDDQQKWKGFSGYATNKMLPYTNVEQLAENVWMINLQKDPAPFGFLVAGAVDQHIDYRILVFDAEPEWLPVGSSRAPTRGRSGGR